MNMDLVPLQMKGNVSEDIGYIPIKESGKIYGQLTILGRDLNDKRKWVCRCGCGTYHCAVGYDIQRGYTTSCGCKFRQSVSQRRMKDLSGKRFGRLTVIEPIRYPNGKIYWKCKCDCGKEIEVYGGELRSGGSKSCGCKKRDDTIQRNWKHGHSKTRLASVYSSMKDRCYNSNAKSYPRYGARGIKMCNEWYDDFETFYLWAVSNGYEIGLTIDRIDNDGDYSPENCRWVSNIENIHNSSTCINIEYNGLKMCCAEWDRRMGYCRGTVSRRLREGKTSEEAINTFQKHKVIK